MKKLLFTASLLLLSVGAQASVATYYGDRFHGRKTASGERFNQNAMTCASNTYAFGTLLKVTNVKNGKSVVCRVNDRGGFSKYGIAIDLSKGAFKQIAPLAQGRARVSITPVSAQEVSQSDNATTSVASTMSATSEQVERAIAAIEPLVIEQKVTIITPKQQ